MPLEMEENKLTPSFRQNVQQVGLQHALAVAVPDPASQYRVYMEAYSVVGIGAHSFITVVDPKNETLEFHGKIIAPQVIQLNLFFQ